VENPSFGQSRAIRDVLQREVGAAFLPDERLGRLQQLSFALFPLEFAFQPWFTAFPFVAHAFRLIGLLPFYKPTVGM